MHCLSYNILKQIMKSCEIFIYSLKKGLVCFNCGKHSIYIVGQVQNEPEIPGLDGSCSSDHC